jgi:thiamine pyrophosphokinase
MGETVIVANAPWRWSEGFVRLVRQAEVVLAADGGANHLARIGVTPDAVVGDLDSLRPEVRAWLGEGRLVARPDQEWTDLHKTLAYAFDERGAKKVTVLAATGGGLDHALENLGLLARWASRGPLEAWDESFRIVPVLSRACLESAPGQRVSLLPLGRCSAVRTAGLRWGLAGEPLDLLGHTGVCNLAEADEIEVECTGGALLVFLQQSPPGW